MVPGFRHWIASHAGGMPGLAGIVPDVPLIASGDPAFVAPNIGIAIDELVDVELQCLRNADILHVKIDVVGKVVKVGDDRVVVVGHALRREVSDQVVIPKHIRVNSLTANVHPR